MCGQEKEAGGITFRSILHTHYCISEDVEESRDQQLQTLVPPLLLEQREEAMLAELEAGQCLLTEPICCQSCRTREGRGLGKKRPHPPHYALDLLPILPVTKDNWSLSTRAWLTDRVISLLGAGRAALDPRGKRGPRDRATTGTNQPASTHRKCHSLLTFALCELHTGLCLSASACWS